MQQLNTSKLVEKKSKFYGYLLSIKTLEEYNEALEYISNEHKKASHICSAAIIGNDEKFKNDGEVGYPGKTILKLLKQQELKNNTIIIVRYFGGIKLGPGGVSRCFKKCAQMLF